jgi:hypothetical protein
MANLLFAQKTDRSLQFEFKLLTKFLFLTAHNALTRRATVRIQPDCQTSAHATRDFAKANYMPASKAVRPQPKPP